MRQPPARRTARERLGHRASSGASRVYGQRVVTCGAIEGARVATASLRHELTAFNTNSGIAFHTTRRRDFDSWIVCALIETCVI